MNTLEETLLWKNNQLHGSNSHSAYHVILLLTQYTVNGLVGTIDQSKNVYLFLITAFCY